MLSLKEKHEKCLYPEVRIRTGQGLGSGTVVFSEPTPGEAGMWDAYILTNEHVVDSLIEVRPKWNPVLRRDVKQDILGHPQVETFRFAYVARAVGGASFQSDIMAYDKDMDLALLRVRSPTEFQHVARILPEEKIKELVAFMPVVNVGCGLGGPPAITYGFLSAFNIEIERLHYMLVTACSIFGNSGGATFLSDTGEFVGIPSRISITLLGWNADVATHLGFSIPVARVYEFLRSQVWDFIIDPNKTSEQCWEEREEKRRQDLLRRLEPDEVRGDGTINPKGKGFPYYSE